MVVHIIVVVKKKSEIPKLFRSVINVSGNSPETTRFCLWVFRLWLPNIHSPFFMAPQDPLGNYSFCFGGTLGQMVNSGPFPPIRNEKGDF